MDLTLWASWEPLPSGPSIVVLTGRATRVPSGAGMSFPRSTSGGQEPHRPLVFGRVVGDAVLPDAPDHPDPGAGQDAHGVGWWRVRWIASASILAAQGRRGGRHRRSRAAPPVASCRRPSGT